MSPKTDIGKTAISLTANAVKSTVDTVTKVSSKASIPTSSKANANANAPSAPAPFFPRLVFPKYNINLSGFQGHHRTGLQRMYQIGPQVDLVFEVRDARAPLSTRNGLFERALGNKEKIILYAKNDLSKLQRKTLEAWHPDGNYMLVDCRSEKDAHRILEIAKKKFGERFPPPPLGINLLITGMPNVGKSTLINTLRSLGDKNSKKVAATGGQAGVTKAVSEKIRLCRNPSIYIFDSPGIFVASTVDQNTMIKLAIIGAVKNNHVDPYIQADFLLFCLNKHDPTGRAYRDILPEPTNNVHKLLFAIAKKIKKVRRGNDFDEIGSAMWWIDRFRQGKGARILLDDCTLEAYEEFTVMEKENLDRFKMDLQSEVKGRRKYFLF